MANIFTSSLTNNVGTTATTVYTAGASPLTSATIIGMTLANNQTTDVTATVSITRTSPSISVDIITGVPIPTGSSFVPIGGDQKVVLLPGDIVQVTSTVAASVDVVVSVLEITST